MEEEVVGGDVHCSFSCFSSFSYFLLSECVIAVFVLFVCV